MSHVHIEGPGTITSYVNGILLNQVSDSHVEQVTCLSNGFEGLLLAFGTTNTHVNNNVFSLNDIGLLGNPDTSDNHLDNNQALNNGRFGIFLGIRATNYHVNGNTALRNGIDDLYDDNPNCDDNKWNGNTFVTANQGCIH